MNRTHRIIWSESRNAFIVASEGAKAKGKATTKPSSTRKTIAAAVLAALGSLAGAPALAVTATSCPNTGGSAISISGSETDTCNLAAGDSLTVNSGGSINAPSGSFAAGVFANTVAVGSIANSGTISGPSSAGIVLLGGSSVTGSITNSGAISGFTGIRLQGSSSVGSITNSGAIGGGAVGIVLQSGSSVTGSITNNAGGMISGSDVGIFLFVGSTVDGITNSGTISGRDGDGIRIRASTVTGSITNNAGGTISGGISLILGSTVNSITNSGTIGGGAVGIVLQDASSVTGSITNNAGGTISGNNTGILLRGASTVTGSITNSGTISGVGNAGVFLSNSSSVGSITNNGLISGSVGSALFNGTVDSITNNAGGTISGGSFGIFLGGTSTVNGSITNSGTISGGSGSSDHAISISANSHVTSGITNTGTINGNVQLNDATLNLNGTSGRIIGNVDDNLGAIINVNGAFTTEGTFNSDAFNITSGGVLNMAHGITVEAGVNNGFNNAGTLAVAAGTTATITGNYTQDASGTFRTNVTDDTTYGKLVVTGTATLPTNAKIDVNVADANFAFTAASMASIISAGTLTWDGTSVVTDNSMLFDFTASKNGNAVDLTLAVASSGGGSAAVLSAVNATGNTPATGAATVLDDLAAAFAGGGTGDADMDVVIGALGGLTTQQQVSDAASQTLPLMTGGMAQATAANLNGVNRVVQARMEEHRGLSSGDGFENGKGWFKPVGSWADQKDSDGAFGYTAETYGVVMGADGERSDVSRMGAAFGYTHSLVHGNSGAQSAKVDSYQFVVYGSRSLNDSTEFNWQADYGYNQNKGSRYISFVNRTAAADYTSHSLHIGTGLGKTIAWKDKSSFVPSIRADYTRIADGAYTETGANALNLVVASKTVEELILSVDAKLVHSLSETSTLTANVGLGYDAMAKQNSITASYAGGGAAFTTDGIKPSASLARIGMGYVHNTDSGMEITARYDAEARSGFIAQTVSAKLRMPF